MTEKIDFWYEHRAELSGLKGAVLKSAEKYRIDKSVSAMEALYEDVIKFHYSPNGQLPKGEKIIP